MYGLRWDPTAENYFSGFRFAVQSPSKIPLEAASKEGVSDINNVLSFEHRAMPQILGIYFDDRPQKTFVLTKIKFSNHGDR